MIEKCLICDRCGSVIAGAKTAKQLRIDAGNLYQQIDGKDVCTNCVPLPHNVRPMRSGLGLGET